MIKWPGKRTTLVEIWRSRDEALAIPVLANLLPEEQSKLIQLAERFTAKRLVPLQGFELDPLKIRASPCSSACRCWSWVSNGWMASTKC